MKTKLVAVISVLAACVGIGCGQGSPQFRDIGGGLPPVGGFLAWGDYDNDGDLDLALSGYVKAGNYVSKIYRNDGGGTFTDINAALVDVGGCSLAWGDYDGDGDLDLALSGHVGAGDYVSKIYRNDGGGTFTDTNAALVDVDGGSLAWGDYDNDGDLDLALAGWWDDGALPEAISRIYRNDGGTTFAEVDVGLTGVWMGPSLAWGDYDNDGDLDLALAGLRTDSPAVSRIYRNDGGGAFTDIDAGLTGVTHGSLAWGDYDSDGDLDLAVAGNYATVVYRNGGGDTFTDISAGLPGLFGCALAWGDCDNDGDLDLALAGNAAGSPVYDPFTKVFRNRGNGVFSEVNDGLVEVCPVSLAWGDCDNDGNLDLALSGYSPTASSVYISRVYRNYCTTANTPPTAPVALSADVFGTDVVLGWNVATDAETLVPGLSYNLRVRPESGPNDVMPGMADPATGLRHIPALGNAQKRCYWILRGLASGTYYWTVQAIDTAFEGSPWAPEETVVVP